MRAASFSIMDNFSEYSLNHQDSSAENRCSPIFYLERYEQDRLYEEELKARRLFEERCRSIKAERLRQENEAWELEKTVMDRLKSLHAREEKVR